MTILDRSIAKQYLFNIVALLLLLSSFVITIDVALNIDRFYREASKTVAQMEPGAAPQWVMRVWYTIRYIADFWGPLLLQLLNYMIGLVLVGAMGFTFAQLTRRRELVAVMASGVSLRRLAAPVFVVAVAVNALQAVGQETLIPRLAPLLVRDHGDVGKRSIDAMDRVMARDSQNRVLLANRFDPGAGTIEQLTVWERDDRRRVVARIDATAASWDGSRWALENGTRTPLVIDPNARELPRTSPPGSVRVLETSVDPTTLLVKRQSAYSQSLSWAELGELIESGAADERLRERFQRIRWGRIASKISTLLAIAITMPFFLMREPKNLVGQSLKAAPVGIAALIGSALGPSIAVPGLPPGFGAFLPVLVLAPIAVASLVSLRT